MKLTKEECRNALSKLTSTKIVEILSDNPYALDKYEKYCSMLEQLINEHFHVIERINENWTPRANELLHDYFSSQVKIKKLEKELEETKREFEEYKNKMERMLKTFK